MAYDGTQIADLNVALPASVAINQAQPTDEWDDAIREIKVCLKYDFRGPVPGGFDGPVTVTEGELNSVPDLVYEYGDQMRGDLEVVAGPTDDLHVVPKQYVDSVFAGGVPASGDDYPYGAVGIASLDSQPLTLNTRYESEHNLGAVPTIFGVRLTCVTADADFEPGDVITVIGPQSNDTGNNQETGGIQRWADATHIGVTTGARIWALREDNGGFVEISPTKWLLSGNAFLIDEAATAQPCAVGTTYQELTTADMSTLGAVFMDHTNNQALYFWRGTATTPAAMFIVNAVNNTLVTKVDATAGAINNRSYGFGYSQNGDGSIDRYILFDRTAGTPGDSHFLVRTTNGSAWKYGTIGVTQGDAIVAHVIETVGWVVFTHAGVIKGIEKDQVPDDMVVTDLDDDPGPQYTLMPFRIPLPNQTYFLQFWASGNQYYIGKYHPDTNTADTPIATGTPKTYQFHGATYDGTYAWVAYSGGGQLSLIKIDADGNYVQAYSSPGGLSGGTDVLDTIDYDPVSGRIMMFWGDYIMRAFDPVSETFVSRTIGSDSNRQKYNGTACSAYTSEESDQGSGVAPQSVRSCVTCIG